MRLLKKKKKNRETLSKVEIDALYGTLNLVGLRVAF